MCESETLLNDMTSHNTAVLVNLSAKFEKAVIGWQKSPARFFFDFGVKIAFCSIDHAFTGMSRSQQLFKLAEDSGFDALCLLKLIGNGYASMFLPNKESEHFQKQFWLRATGVLGQHGFDRFVNYAFYAPEKELSRK
jgi:hypothetical protein